jgi:hypothetical protein
MELRVAGLLWFPESVDGVAGLHLTPVIWRANDIPGISNQPGVVADGGVFRPYGTTSEDVAVRARGSAGPGELVIDLWLFLVGFWHLSRQKITESTEQEVPRKTAVNAARAGLRYPDGITVIGLRHHDRGDGARDDGSSSVYRVRWAVRGHWRQQWYPSIKSNRPVYIHPYLKGPADAPLKNGSTVWVATGADLRDGEPEQVDSP